MCGLDHVTAPPPWAPACCRTTYKGLPVTSGHECYHIMGWLPSLPIAVSRRGHFIRRGWEWLVGGGEGWWIKAKPAVLYFTRDLILGDDALLYIADVMLIWAAPIPADRWHCSLWS